MKETKKLFAELGLDPRVVKSYPEMIAGYGEMIIKTYIRIVGYGTMAVFITMWLLTNLFMEPSLSRFWWTIIVSGLWIFGCGWRIKGEFVFLDSMVQNRTECQMAHFKETVK